MNLAKLSFFILISLLFQASSIAQDWTSYLSEQQINDLVDTGDELLMATDAGLVVLNKSTLEKTIYNKSNSILTNNHIQSITQAPDGSNWIGVYDVQLFQFNGTGFEPPIMTEGSALDQFTELYDFKIAPNGDFWIGTNDGIFHRQGQDWTHYDADDLGPSLFDVWDMEITVNGDVFIASIDLHKFSNGIWTNLTEGTNIGNYNSSDLFTSSTGDLYMAGDLEKVSRFDGSQWESFDIDFNGSEVLKLTEDVDGNIYFNTTQNGIYKLENDTWVQQDDPQATAFNNTTNYFHIDEDNNRWMNRNIHLSVNQGGTIQTTLISDYKIESNNIQNIQKGTNGKLYFITGSQENISILNTDGSWSFLPKPSIANPFAFYHDILALSDDNIWLTTSAGLYNYDGNDWTLMNSIGGLGLDVDSQGKIYIQSNDKISIFDNGTFTEYNTGNSDITSLLISGHGIDANDNLWVASGDWDEDNVIQKVSTDGIWTTYSAIDYPAIDRPVGDFHFDAAGNAWITEGAIGALKISANEITNPFIGNINEMASYNAFSIQSDATGKMYFSHQYGVTTLLDGEWGDLLIEDIPQSINNGDSSIQFDDEGTLWWGSQRHGVFSSSSLITSSTTTFFEQNANLSLYPNPTRGYVNLEFECSKNTVVNLAIINNLGQRVSSLDLGFFPEGTFQHRLDLTHFPKGIYKIQLQLDHENSTQTLVIQ